MELQIKVAQAVHALNHDSQSRNRVAANQWLVQFQQTDLAWDDRNTINSSSPSLGDGYVALFVRMFGLDNDPLDREQAIVAFSTCEAAAGLLQEISSINLYRESVAESGAIEEITGLLRHSSLTSEVKEQSICTLWNLSVDEKLRMKIANTDLLPLAIKSLEDEDIKVKEAAGGVLVNLALSKSLHSIMVEAGGSCHSANDWCGCLQGLDTRLNIDDKNAEIDKSKINAVVGRTQQQFLARIGAIEVEDERKSQSVSTSQRFTLLPWMDGVAWLVLILGLEDELAISRAAESISDASINEHMRISFKEAGAVNNSICQLIESEGVMYPLLNALKHSGTSETLMEKTLDILARILDPAVSESTTGKDVMDSAVIARLIEILKTPSPNLQRKASSILEFLTIIEQHLDTILSVDIESGLEAVFQQKILDDTESDMDDLELTFRSGKTCG
ncbi:hypothetical protein AAG906_039728 [Vitis piasezkii]